MFVGCFCFKYEMESFAEGQGAAETSDELTIIPVTHPPAAQVEEGEKRE